ETLGYKEYSSAQELVNGFMEDAAYNRKNTALPVMNRSLHNDVFYLRCLPFERTASYLSRAITKDNLLVVQDDPQEAIGQSLPWYIENVDRSIGVLAHFGTFDHPEIFASNHVYALVCGIALGRKKRVLMLSNNNVSI